MKERYDTYESIQNPTEKSLDKISKGLSKLFDYTPFDSIKSKLDNYFKKHPKIKEFYNKFIKPALKIPVYIDKTVQTKLAFLAARGLSKGLMLENISIFYKDGTFFIANKEKDIKGNNVYVIYKSGERGFTAVPIVVIKKEGTKFVPFSKYDAKNIFEKKQVIELPEENFYENARKKLEEIINDIGGSKEMEEKEKQ